MAHHWLEIRIPAPAVVIELLGQSLLDLGCSGINVGEYALDTFEAPPELPMPKGDTVVRAYFPDTDQRDQLSDAILAVLEDLARFFPELTPAAPDIRRLAEEDWEKNWQQHFPPFQVGETLLIRPSWSDQLPTEGQALLTLDPGQAFGTGTHATTSLCLDVITRLAATEAGLGKVLDVGTGSGILALAAAALNAAEVLACDIDPQARQIARENIDQNGLTTQITVTDLFLEEILGRFDLVLANILAKENIRLRPEFLQRMAPGSHLILSGILIEQEADVIAAFENDPLTLESVDRKDDWTCLTYRYHG